MFNSSYYLDGHLQRRHSDKLPVRPLQVTTAPIVQDPKNDLQKMTEALEKFSLRISDTERELRKELEDKMEEKLNQEVRRRQKVLEDEYSQERLRYSQEIQQLKVCRKR